MSKTTKVKIFGNKKDGYILEVSNSKDGFLFNESFIEDELIEIYKAIGKKLKLDK